MVDSKLNQRIDTILKNIQTVQNDLKDLTLEEFKQSDLHVRGTCFSLMQISEHMNKIYDLVGEKYPEMPWRKAINMRNLIVHVYNHVKAEIIYETAMNDLKPLYDALLKIKDDLRNNC